ncbi:IPT/TIG domain-containing protein [Chitinophaga niabensis]|uniref:NHL repeat-containing protein n=1 Tax=Chitinophaga niabensis TaxID=536979 RepID=A0A1N6H5B5_9BACT|nr:IPT/TIG domain-containing protein [Chitinophaga niabensis]SIO14857.1 NHL repeat-containing protein [Chitinophaga niabensis]
MIKPLIRSIIFSAVFIAGCKKDDKNVHVDGAPMSVESFVPLQGGGGTSILISGVNFTGDTSQLEITINGNKLAIVGANTKQIMAVVPKKCGSGKVTVKIGKDVVNSTMDFNYVFTRTVSTLAGNGNSGYANGKGDEVEFNFKGEPWYRSQGIAVDKDLNVYVADPGNHCIRKIDSTGTVTLFCGNPNSSGYADGKGLDAKFIYPYDVAVDKDGNVFSVDPINWDIRKITPDGTATTWLWAAQEPWMVAIDKSTNLPYYGNHSGAGGIYKITAQFAAERIIADISWPAGFDFDKDGNLYLSGNGDNTITKYAKGTWAPTIIAGQKGVAGYQNGPGPAAKFSNPWGLEVDAAGNIFVAGNGTGGGDVNSPDQSIRFIAANTWTVSTYAGSSSAGYSDAIGESAAFSAPGGVAIDKNGTVYVLDKNNNRVRKIVSE